MTTKQREQGDGARRLSAALAHVAGDLQNQVALGAESERICERAALVIALATELRNQLQAAAAIREAGRLARAAIAKARQV